MTSLPAATSAHGSSDEYAEHEAACLVHEAETALHEAREPGVDAWIEKWFGNDEPAE
jgi:hypothetical protein